MRSNRKKLLKLVSNFIPLLLICIALALSSYNFYLFKRIPKLAYINTIEVYNDFNLKKQLEGKLDALRSQNLIKLDSINMSLQSYHQMIDQKGKLSGEDLSKLEIKEKYYKNKKEAIENNHDKLVAQFNEQIWNQLNQYIKDYGEEHGLTFIYGATGSGNIMHANENFDLTKEILKYVNARFEGESKEL